MNNCIQALLVKLSGTVNSFRLPDHQTYHRTLPLPPKTTVAGLLGSALGLHPSEVNEHWLLTDRFKVAIRGRSEALFKDLWQYRKYTDKHINAYFKGEEEEPYYRAVMVRELLYQSTFELYLFFDNTEDYSIVKNALANPAWALSLGREDEVVKLTGLETVECAPINSSITLHNTVVQFDVYEQGFKPAGLDFIEAKNLLAYAPTVVRLPVAFSYTGEVRQANAYETFSFVGGLAMTGSTELPCFQHEGNHILML